MVSFETCNILNIVVNLKDNNCAVQLSLYLLSFSFSFNFNTQQAVSVLQKLLLACEKELDAIDMVINVKKSSCLRVGCRHKVTCAEITTSDRNNLP